MKKVIKLIMIPLLLLISVTLYAHSLDEADANVAKEMIASFIKKNNVPGVAVEMYQDGKSYSYYFGYADQNKKTPISRNTIFEVGSITKVMTSLLLAQQVDAAKMQLNDSIRKYLPELPDTFDEMTLLNLATHTSGLPFNAPENIKNRTQFEKYMAHWSPTEAPGQQWRYSNVGIGMLGFSLEASTHKNFNQLYRSRILAPLGMQPIALIAPDRLKRFYAEGHDEEGKPVKHSSLGLFPAADGLKASAGDMQQFLHAAIGLPGTPEKILYPMRMTQAAYVKLDNKIQGLGWQIHLITPDDVADLLDEPQSMDRGPIQIEEIYKKPVFNGDALIDQTGGTEGFRTYVALIPNKKSGIVILTNKAVSNAAIVNAGRKILFQLTELGINTE